MITWPRAILLISGTCAAIVWGLAACSKAPSQQSEAPQASASAPSQTIPAGSLAAGLQEPPLEVPKGNNPEVAAMREKYVRWIVEKAMPAGLRKPAFPDPNRTDETSLLMRYKFALWGIAESKVASDAALKQQAQSLGLDKPGPKGNYSRMADGLKPLPAHKN